MFAEKNLDAGELLLIAGRDWYFDFNVLVEDVVAGAREGAREGLADLKGCKVLEGERYPESGSVARRNAVVESIPVSIPSLRSIFEYLKYCRTNIVLRV